MDISLGSSLPILDYSRKSDIRILPLPVSQINHFSKSSSKQTIEFYRPWEWKPDEEKMQRCPIIIDRISSMGNIKSMPLKVSSNRILTLSVVFKLTKLIHDMNKNEL